jgi:hypothetical protein
MVPSSSPTQAPRRPPQAPSETCAGGRARRLASGVPEWGAGWTGTGTGDGTPGPAQSRWRKGGDAIRCGCKTSALARRRDLDAVHSSKSSSCYFSSLPFHVSRAPLCISCLLCIFLLAVIYSRLYPIPFDAISLSHSLSHYLPFVYADIRFVSSYPIPILLPAADVIPCAASLLPRCPDFLHVTLLPPAATSSSFAPSRPPSRSSYPHHPVLFLLAPPGPSSWSLLIPAHSLALYTPNARALLLTTDARTRRDRSDAESKLLHGG